MIETSNDNFRFKAGIEASPDAAIILSPELKIISGNKKSEAITWFKSS
jgi:PAS domain-containing protein